ncbi:MAG: T9SS type A sorting domain-containing protein [Saprospiraceae bacterium]
MKKQLAFFLCLGFLMTANVMFAQPANDDCGGAVPVTIGADEASAIPVAGTNLGATASGSGTGSPGTVCSGSWYQDDVWYSFTTGATVPANGVTIKVIPGTMGLLGMAIYTSCDSTATSITCFSADINDGVDSQELQFVQANTTYLVRMWSGGGTNVNSGTFDIIVYENFVDPNQPVDIVHWGATPGEGDFGGGLNGWTSNALTTGNDWIWEADATSNGAFGNTLITSPTASNGAALFDADFMSTQGDPANAPGQPYPVYNAELLSPIIDCSMLPELSVKFYQAFRGLGTSAGTFSYSIDGGNTFSTPISVNSDVASNDASANPSIKRYDLPGASGSSQVQLKFSANMSFYYWLIDDVQLVEKAANDIALANGFIAVAPKYSMPQTSIDTIRFVADVANNGVNDATNVVLSVDIVRNSDNVSVFSSNNVYGTIPAGDSVENQIFTDFFVPDTTIESYTATYTLSSDSSDLVPGDNSYSFGFEVVEDYFDRVETPTNDVALAGSYGYGVVYRVRGGTIIDGVNNLDTLYHEVSSVTMGIANADDLGGQSVQIFIEKANGSNRFTPNPTNGEILLAERKIVGSGTYTFTGNEPEDFVLNMPIEDFDDPSKLAVLQSDVDYIVMMQYNASPDPDLNLFMFSSEAGAYPYAATEYAIEQTTGQNVFSLVSSNSGNLATGTYIAGGSIVADVNEVPSRQFVPYLRMNFMERFATSTNSTLLDENVLTVFPNPADEFITATLELEKMSASATLTIFNVTGQVMETRNITNVINEQVRFNLSDYTSGTYYMSIETEEGRSTKRFVIAK